MQLSLFRPRAFTVLIGLAALGLLIYANAIFHPFVHDDVAFIQFNPNISRWDNIGEAFVNPGVPFQGLKISTPYYRPFLEVLYRLQYSVFGMNPHGFHFLNIILHILTAWLVFLAVRFWGIQRDSAVAVAILFLVHPVQSEAVACISGISNLAVSILLLAAFICYARARTVRHRSGARETMLAAGCFILAFFTKELAVVFPAFLLVYELAFVRRRKVAGTTALLGLFFVLAAAYLAWRGHIFPGHLGAALNNLPELWLRVLAIPRTVLTFLGLIVWPAGLHYYRSTDILASPGLSWGILCVLVAFLVLSLRAMPCRLKRSALLGMAWGVVFLMPAFNIIPLINEYSLVLTAEHFLYLSLAGFLVAAVSYAAWLFPFVSRKAAVAVLGLIILVFGLVTVRQNTFWRAEVPLFERVVRFEPKLGRAHILLAKAYAYEAKFREALPEYTKALNIMNDYVTKSRHPKAREAYLQFVKAIHRDRGDIYLVSGEPQQAVMEFRASLAIRLDGLSSADTGVDDSGTANNLAMLLMQMGDRAQARRWWQSALLMNARNADALNNLGMMAFEREDREAAVFFFTRAQAVVPSSVPVAQNLARARQLK